MGHHDKSGGSQPAKALSRRKFLGLLSVAALGAAGGCIGLAEPDFTIDMTERKRYSPATLTVRAGSRVAWKNTDTFSHTATFDPDLLRQETGMDVGSSANHWDSGDIYSGQTWTHVFDTPGEYLYFCKYHGGEGMIGTINVVNS